MCSEEAYPPAHYDTTKTAMNRLSLACTSKCQDNRCKLQKE